VRYNPVSGELRHAAELHVTTFSGQDGLSRSVPAAGGDFATAYAGQIAPPGPGTATTGLETL
jgi:hypothetical protein